MVATLRVSDKQQSLSLRHADDDEAFLLIVFAIVKALYSERVVKHRFRQFKATP